ncbi:alpha/beta family hydrolase [Rheinheimera metallidurans]|uniref:alpha/beta family hydrolase n=1 Tax=Rheinheimera metallidurans TaxID=2925781 RepID=UPI0030011C4C
MVNNAVQPKARLLLAHGAGAGANSDFMQLLAEQLALRGIEVWRFNFAYMQRMLDSGKRSLPEKLPALQQQYVAQLAKVNNDLPLFIGGKSMGGRVASMLTAQAKVQGVFAFGYPFHAPKKDSWRTEHFARLGCPLFIAQGERDVFGSACELLDKHWDYVQIYWLTDGDHDLKPRVKSGTTHMQLIIQAAQFCSRKIDEVLLANK